MSSKPALPCPPWCESRHGGPADGTSHQAHRYFSDHAGRVSLYQADAGSDAVFAYRNGEINIHVAWHDPQRAVIRPLAEAQQLAELAEAFGRSDVAAIIRELAAQASGGAR